MVKIIYEDDWLMVVDKPSGLLVIPTPKKETHTLTNILNKELQNRGLKVKAYPCHRLDRETSGLIIYAKAKHVQRLMMQEFKNLRVKKRYIGFVHGHPREIKNTLKSDIKEPHSHKIKLAVTQYRIIQKRPNFSVLEVYPITGRTNQIRIQFKEIGHPLVGERRFVFAKDYRLKFRRVALHAKELIFKHPITHQAVHLICNLPADMQGLLNNPS